MTESVDNGTDRGVAGYGHALSGLVTALAAVHQLQGILIKHAADDPDSPAATVLMHAAAYTSDAFDGLAGAWAALIDHPASTADHPRDHTPADG